MAVLKIQNKFCKVPGTLWILNVWWSLALLPGSTEIERYMGKCGSLIPDCRNFWKLDSEGFKNEITDLFQLA